jgi:SAM-dependent methyltransferase
MADESDRTGGDEAAPAAGGAPGGPAEAEHRAAVARAARERELAARERALDSQPRGHQRDEPTTQPWAPTAGDARDLHPYHDPHGLLGPFGLHTAARSDLPNTGLSWPRAPGAGGTVDQSVDDYSEPPAASAPSHHDVHGAAGSESDSAAWRGAGGQRPAPRWPTAESTEAAAATPIPGRTADSVSPAAGREPRPGATPPEPGPPSSVEAPTSPMSGPPVRDVGPYAGAEWPPEAAGTGTGPEPYPTTGPLPTLPPDTETPPPYPPEAEGRLSGSPYTDARPLPEGGAHPPPPPYPGSDQGGDAQPWPTPAEQEPFESARDLPGPEDDRDYVEPQVHSWPSLNPEVASAAAAAGSTPVGEDALPDWPETGARPSPTAASPPTAADVPQRAAREDGAAVGHGADRDQATAPAAEGGDQDAHGELPRRRPGAGLVGSPATGHVPRTELVERAWSWFGRIADHAATRLPTHHDQPPTGPGDVRKPVAPRSHVATPPGGGLQVDLGSTTVTHAARTPDQGTTTTLEGGITVEARTSPVRRLGRGGRPTRPTVGYALHGGDADAHRLAAQARVLEPGTLAFLTGLGVRYGWRCLDVGCGHGQVSVLLAGLVRPGGRVVGIDGDPDSLRVARGVAADAGAAVTFLAADAGGLPAARGRFNLAYSRLLLGHLTEPVETLRAMAAAVRPGGIVAVEDICFSAPQATDAVDEVSRHRRRALTALIELMTMTIRSRGGDPQIGPRLPALFTAAGLVDVTVEIREDAVPFDPSGRLLVEALDATQDAALAAGLADAVGLDRLRRELAGLLPEEVATVTRCARLYQVAGRRPRRAGQAVGS